MPRHVPPDFGEIGFAGAGFVDELTVTHDGLERESQDEIRLDHDDGPSCAPDASGVRAASRGPFYFAWGCFRDFLSRGAGADEAKAFLTRNSIRFARDDRPQIRGCFAREPRGG